MPRSLGTTGLVLSSQPTLLKWLHVLWKPLLQRKNRHRVREDKKNAWGKVIGERRMVRHPYICSMTPSALLVLHEGAQKIEKEAVVLGYLSDQWPVKVTIIRGVGFWRARGNAGPLSGGPHRQGARVNLDTVSSTIKPTISRGHRQQTEPFWPE